MYFILIIVSFVLKYAPEIIGIIAFFTFFSLGRLVQTIGNDATTEFIIKVFPICTITSAIISIVLMVFVWKHYEETISRGSRRWMSNLSFFQNRFGFTMVTLLESLVINFLLIYSIVALIVVCCN